MIRNKRVFITGGAGFIGTEIVRRLSADNSNEYSKRATDPENTMFSGFSNILNFL